MSLRAQVEWMTTPQEFSRLCESVLQARHGDDFLPIDDDRGDRGNDGYLKSEHRLFAAHCFKRIQNKSVDTDIRTKMVGDLKKAIALKKDGSWHVEAWTFLSNYPIPEKLAAEIVAIGAAAGIDVSWRGPGFFEAGLHRYPEVLSAFPTLQTSHSSKQLAQIQEALAERNASIATTEDDEPENETART